MIIPTDAGKPGKILQKEIFKRAKYNCLLLKEYA